MKAIAAMAYMVSAVLAIGTVLIALAVLSAPAKSESYVRTYFVNGKLIVCTVTTDERGRVLQEICNGG
jgi:hypothetical protein